MNERKKYKNIKKEIKQNIYIKREKPKYKIQVEDK